MGHGAKAWVSDFNHPHYMAGRKAMKTGVWIHRQTLPLRHTRTGLTYLNIYNILSNNVSRSLPPIPFFHIVFGVEPDLTREGGSIPVTLTFQEATGRNVMLLPMGSSDDGAHSQNEKFNRLAATIVFLSILCLECLPWDSAQDLTHILHTLRSWI